MTVFNADIYVLIAKRLGADGLCCTDAVCRRFREENGCLAELWRELGMWSFFGMEVAYDGQVQSFEEINLCWLGTGLSATALAWKEHYGLFRWMTTTFKVDGGDS